MQPIYAFIIKSFIVSLILVGYYWFFLRNNRFHQYNRFYLLGTVLISILLPLIKFNWFELDRNSVQTVEYVADLMQGQYISKIPDAGHLSDRWIFYFYLAISVIFALGAIIGISRIYVLKKKSNITKMESIDFMETDYEAAPFSFLNNIFWRKNIDISSNDGQKIFKHELAHVREYHTYDKLFCNLVLSIFWVNPVFWIIRYELNNIHEFIADEQSLKGVEVSEFSRLLLSIHFGNRYFPAGQNFFHSSIKRRLQMFKKSKTTKFSYLRRLMALPLFLFTIALFSFSVSEHAASEIDQNVKIIGEKVVQGFYMNVDTIPGEKLPTPPTPPKSPVTPQQPKSAGSKLPAPPPPPKEASPKLPAPPPPPKSVSANSHKVKNNSLQDPNISIEGIWIQEPEHKTTEHIQVDTVVINEKDQQQLAKPILLEGLNKGETIVVWNGNSVSTDKAENLHRYDNLITTIDIIGPEKAASIYGYKGKEKITVLHIKPHITVVGRPLKEEKKTNDPGLILLDGKEITATEMSKLDQKLIESVNVWKGEKAMEKFGKKGERGVIEIKMKKQ